MNLARDLQIALHDDAVGDLQHEQQEHQQAAPEMEVKFGDVRLVVGALIVKTSTGKDEHYECGQQQHAARGRQLFQNSPEKFFDDVQAAAAAREVVRSFGGNVAGVETVTGAGFGFKL